VFNDNRDRIAELTPAGSSIREETGFRDHPPTPWQSFRGHLSAGASLVLDLLKDMRHLNRILERCGSHGLMGSMVEPLVSSIRASLGKDILNQYDLSKNSARETLVHLLNANSSKTVRLPSDIRFQAFLSHYTGQHLRWETIGALFTACGLCIMCLDCGAPELAFVGNSESERQRLRFRVLTAADICLSLCHNSDASGTDLGFWFMLDDCVHASQVLGDAHYAVWRKLGDISTAVFARGLHAESKRSTDPFWLQEFRRKALATAYVTDKLISTFVGRPPRVSKRYCHMIAPLDLEYSELALGDKDMADVRARLDDDGWMSACDSRKYRASTSLRMSMLGAFVREEVLELCLGPVQHDHRPKVESLIARSQALYASFPSWACYSDSVLDKHPSGRSYFKIKKYLDNVYNEFVSHIATTSCSVTHDLGFTY
jgi:hypothetical protein